MISSYFGLQSTKIIIILILFVVHGKQNDCVVNLENF